MPSTRARDSTQYVLCKLALRIVSLLLSIIVLVFLIYMTTRYKKNFPVAYAAIIYAFFLDTAAIVALSDRHHSVPQFSALLMMVLELGAMGLIVGGCVTMVFADLTEEFHNKPGYKYPADPWRTDAFWMLVAVGAFHVFYSMLSCVDGWRGA